MEESIEEGAGTTSFLVEGVRCEGRIFRPPGEGPFPAVLLGHGFAGTQEVRLPAFARRFAEEGFVCLTFDYRHFGASGGEPRQLLSVGRQLADWRAALEHLRALPEVDPERIALWGTSFSGGHVVRLASEGAAVAACIAQIPFADGIPVTLERPPLEALRLTFLSLRDHLRGLLGRPPLLVPVVGPPGSMSAMNTPDAMPGYRSIIPEGVDWVNEVAARILLAVPLYRPVRGARRIACPLLVALARDDRVTPPAPARRVAARAPRAELLEFDGGHFDLYLGEPFEELVAAEIDFLHRHLRVAEPAPKEG